MFGTFLLNLSPSARNARARRRSGTVPTLRFRAFMREVSSETGVKPENEGTALFCNGTRIPLKLPRIDNLSAMGQKWSNEG
jgi:hypothetical protein